MKFKTLVALTFTSLFTINGMATVIHPTTNEDLSKSYNYMSPASPSYVADLSETLTFGDTYFKSNVTTKGSFLQTIKFVLPDSSSSFAGSNDYSIQTVKGKKFIKDIADLKFELKKGAVTIGSFTDGQELTDLVLSHGDYELLVTGKAIGNVGGEYSAAFNVSPVPEVEEWMMMSLGLGLIGLQVKRKSRS